MAMYFIVHLLIYSVTLLTLRHNIIPSLYFIATHISPKRAPGAMTMMAPSRKSKRPKRTTINEASRVGTTPMEASVNAGVLPATSPPATAPTAGAPVPPPPTQCELTSRMEQSVLDVREKFRPEQTADVYDNKTQEYLQFASHVYPLIPTRTV